MVFRSPWPDIAVPSCSICDEILGVASHLGDKPAVIESETGRILTYHELIQGSGRVAAGLSRAGLQPRQPLAVALPNCIDFVLAWYGALRLGAWVVPMNPLYTPAEMEMQIRDSGARYLLTIPERAGALEHAVDHVFAAEGNWNEIVECSAPAPSVRSSAEDLAIMPYSSGTTGKPKGVMLTHFNIVANFRQMYAADFFSRDDLMVNTAPFYHVVGAISFLNGLLSIGATIVLLRRYDLERWLALNEQYHATAMFAAPPVVLAITKSPLWDRFRLQSIKSVFSGAAPLGTDLHKAFEERTGLVLRLGYGMTEATAAISMTPNDPAKRKFGGSGYLLPSCEARVIDVANGRELGPSETGEIWLRGPVTMKGYWNQPSATEESFPGDGWMRTGDIGHFDADGYVFLVDRLKEFIKYNALQVSPAELEDILQSHPAVQDAAVVGAPDEAAGEIPMAFIVRKEKAALGAGEIMEYVAARVAPYKKIRAVEFVDQIPKSPAGKILRRVLREGLRTRHATSS